MLFKFSLFSLFFKIENSLFHELETEGQVIKVESCFIINWILIFGLGHFLGKQISPWEQDVKES